MKIILLDFSPDMVGAWKIVFEQYKNVEIVCEEFTKYIKKHDEIDGIVSPGNSFGVMNGGYDLAITKYFGKRLMAKVQKEIKEKYNGCQPISSTLLVEIPNEKGRYLIHCPTMVMPSAIKDHTIVHSCCLNTLKEAKKAGIKNLLIPAFGGLTGGLEPTIVAAGMGRAYKEFIESEKK